MPLQQPMPRRSATVWLVQLTHLKTSGLKHGPSYLKGNPLNKKIRLYAAAQNQGHAAAAASTRATTCVTLGDQNLTAEEVLNNPLCQSLVLHASLIAASDGVWDNNGQLHQDLIVVDADPGVRMAPIRSENQK